MDLDIEQVVHSSLVCPHCLQSFLVLATTLCGLCKERIVLSFVLCFCCDKRFHPGCFDRHQDGKTY